MAFDPIAILREWKDKVASLQESPPPCITDNTKRSNDPPVALAASTPRIS